MEDTKDTKKNFEDLTTDWKGLYGESWKGLITDEAFAHPAKFSRALIGKIYSHLIEEGLLRPGDTVLDPFGGVALGGFNAMRLGLHWVGMELEEKFHTLGNGNIDLWRERFPWFPGTAVLLKGDSRKLCEVLGARCDGAVSSPPYVDSVNSGTANIDWEKAGRPDRLTTTAIAIQGANNHEMNYGSTPGQLGGMKEGDFSAAITSPPYDQARIDGQGDEGASGLRNEDGSFVRGKEGWEQRKALGGRYGDTDGNLANLPSGDFQLSIVNSELLIVNEGVDGVITSPPFLQSSGGKGIPYEEGALSDKGLMARHAAGNSAVGYGESEGQLASMPDEGFTAAISSPPFGEAQSGGGIAVKGYQNDTLRPGSDEKPFDLVGERSYMPNTQGQTDGQLGVMKMDDFEGAVSSPPYEGFVVKERSSDVDEERLQAKGLTENKYGLMANGLTAQEKYSDDPDNIGNTSGESFWLAARQIVEQVYLLLAPGAPAVWVVKDYVRNKQIVPFCDQWRQLCEAVGFETVHLHRAWLVEERGTQLDLMGNAHTKRVERKSFFRRLAEKKGSPRIDWEMVICMRKPAQP